MMVSAKGSTWNLIKWQRKYTQLFIVASAVIVGSYELLGRPHWYELPTLPLTVVGAALGIFVSFRTQAGYNRWWEGRKLWGQLVNVSRHFASQAKHYLSDYPQGNTIARQLVLRHVIYVHTLRCSLRLHPLEHDEDLQRLLKLQPEKLEGSNPSHGLIDEQFRSLKSLHQQKAIDSMTLRSFDASLRVMLDVQGGCERIKKTPMPQGYGFMASRLIVYYSMLLPFALVKDLGWIAIPMNVLVCLSLALISEAGRVLEDPFNMFYNGLPLTQLSRMIETNLREQFGDQNLPPIPQPDTNGILL